MTRDQQIATDTGPLDRPETSSAAGRYCIRFLLDRLALLGEDVSADSLVYGSAVRLAGWTGKRVVAAGGRKGGEWYDVRPAK